MKPTLDQLKSHLDRFGPEGIVESAGHLPEEEREALARLVASVKRPRKVRRRKRK